MSPARDPRHARPLALKAAAAVAILALVGASALGVGCAGPRDRAKPAWVDGTSERFPAEDYLVGLGQADTRPSATERAYEAVARIFKAEVRAQARDWESYLLLEERGTARHQRRVTIDHVTKVSTDKVLENVQVLDSWHDADSGLYYALAGMNRRQAESTMLERIGELDRQVATEVRASRATEDQLARIRNLRRAINNLVLREAYNADLRVIRTSGQGHPPAYRVADLTAELEEFLNGNLLIRVEVRGEQAEPIRRAVIEGLVRQGLPVMDRGPESEDGSAGQDADQPLALLIRGSARLWRADVPDPMFQYVRWCADFVVTREGNGKVVGAVSRRGREGHLTHREAMNRALRVMQEELTADLARSLADYVYGETGEPAAGLPPAACPRENGRARGPVHSNEPNHEVLMGKQPAKTKANADKPQRRTPSRLAKASLVARIREDTKQINAGSLTKRLRKQGYEEIPLDELQDRLSKLRTPLADLILQMRG